MKHRFDAISPRKIVVIAGSIVLYLIVLLVLILLVFRGEEAETVFGSMEGRFQSDITMEYEGHTYYYRENEITNYLIIGLDGERNSRGEQDDLYVVLSLDRVNKTVTPVMPDQNIAEQPDPGADAAKYDDTARSLEDLLYGVKIDHYLVLTPEAAAEVSRSFDPASDTAQILELIRSLSDQIQTDASWNTLLRDASRMAEYTWSETQPLELPAEEQALRETVIRLWFQKGT